LDFWLGEWALSWPAEQTGGEAGDRLTGRNSITRLFDNCVIEENFTTHDGGFRGHSVSLYDENAAIWRQTWVDSAGSYLWFTGGLVDGEMVLSTEPTEREGEVMVNRMVFTDVTPDSLEWAWQRSADGGQTWADLWNISYQRHA
jgi:hypothetical protein